MVLVAMMVLLISCAAKEPPAQVKGLTQVEEVKKNTLRIGITPDNAPMIFKLNGKIAGVEADLARKLAKELDRPGEFIALNWEDQIPALMKGIIDIIMSGMTITQERKVRIAFTERYMKSGLLTLMRTGDAATYDSLQKIKATTSNVGVIADTTGESFARKNFPQARVVVLTQPRDAHLSLKNRRIDLFVHDAPSVIWLVSENESELKGYWKLLNEESLGWGIRQNDKDLLAQVNSILIRWKKDGTLKEVLLRWLPYLKRKDLSGMIG
jgi:polar amino acid transport system substrate-binding protein